MTRINHQPLAAAQAGHAHPPSIDRLKAAVAERGLSRRVSAIVGNMARPGQPLGAFDLIWSEGALYSIGLREALRVCHGLLRPGGYLAFTDEAWWDDFHTPMQKRIAELRGKYAGDVEASAILDQLAEEPELHRRHSDFYA